MLHWPVAFIEYLSNCVASECSRLGSRNVGLKKMPSSWLMYIFLYVLVCDGVVAQVENRVVFLFNTFQNVNVNENETVQAVVSRIPPEVAFITLQFHTQHSNATLSYTRMPGLGLSLTAVDSGLLSPLIPGQTKLSWFLLAPDGDSVAGTGVILPYTSSDPVPGACNLEFDLDIDPNVYLHYNIFETTIRFAPANIGYSRGSNPPACDTEVGENTRWRLRYDIYQYFLPESDLSEQSLITSIQSVANVQTMREHGKRLMTLSSNDKTEVVFSSIPGQGVIYSVIVGDPVLNTSSSYIPVHTYACSFSSTLDGCDTLGKISTRIFFTIAGLAGLFVCFFGHRFFKCELFCMGFGFAAFIFFVLITRTTKLDYDIRLTLTAVIGVVGGVILVMSWWRFGSVMSCVVVVGLMLGFLISSIVFFTLFRRLMSALVNRADRDVLSETSSLVRTRKASRLIPSSSRRPLFSSSSCLILSSSSHNLPSSTSIAFLITVAISLILSMCACISVVCCSFNWVTMAGSSFLLAMRSLKTCSLYLVMMSSMADWCSSRDVLNSLFSCCRSRICRFSCWMPMTRLERGRCRATWFSDSISS